MDSTTVVIRPYDPASADCKPSLVDLVKAATAHDGDASVPPAQKLDLIVPATQTEVDDEPAVSEDVLAKAAAALGIIPSLADSERRTRSVGLGARRRLADQRIPTMELPESILDSPARAPDRSMRLRDIWSAVAEGGHVATSSPSAALPAQHSFQKLDPYVTECLQTAEGVVEVFSCWGSALTLHSSMDPPTVSSLAACSHLLQAFYQLYRSSSLRHSISSSDQSTRLAAFSCVVEAHRTLQKSRAKRLFSAVYADLELDFAHVWSLQPPLDLLRLLHCQWDTERCSKAETDRMTYQDAVTVERQTAISLNLHASPPVSPQLPQRDMAVANAPNSVLTALPVDGRLHADSSLHTMFMWSVMDRQPFVDTSATARRVYQLLSEDTQTRDVWYQSTVELLQYMDCNSARVVDCQRKMFALCALLVPALQSSEPSPTCTPVLWRTVYSWFKREADTRDARRFWEQLQRQDRDSAAASQELNRELSEERKALQAALTSHRSSHVLRALQALQQTLQAVFSAQQVRSCNTEKPGAGRMVAASSISAGRQGLANSPSENCLSPDTARHHHHHQQQQVNGTPRANAGTNSSPYPVVKKVPEPVYYDPPFYSLARVDTILERQVRKPTVAKTFTRCGALHSTAAGLMTAATGRPASTAPPLATWNGLSAFPASSDAAETGTLQQTGRVIEPDERLAAYQRNLYARVKPHTLIAVVADVWMQLDPRVDRLLCVTDPENAEDNEVLTSQRAGTMRLTTHALIWTLPADMVPAAGAGPHTLASPTNTNSGSEASTTSNLTTMLPHTVRKSSVAMPSVIAAAAAAQRGQTSPLNRAVSLDQPQVAAPADGGGALRSASQADHHPNRDVSTNQAPPSRAGTGSHFSGASAAVSSGDHAQQPADSGGDHDSDELRPVRLQSSSLNVPGDHHSSSGFGGTRSPSLHNSSDHLSDAGTLPGAVNQPSSPRLIDRVVSISTTSQPQQQASMSPRVQTMHVRDREPGSPRLGGGGDPSGSSTAPMSPARHLAAGAGLKRFGTTQPVVGLFIGAARHARAALEAGDAADREGLLDYTTSTRGAAVPQRSLTLDDQILNRSVAENSRSSRDRSAEDDDDDDQDRDGSDRRVSGGSDGTNPDGASTSTEPQESRSDASRSYAHHMMQGASDLQQLLTDMVRTADDEGLRDRMLAETPSRGGNASGSGASSRQMMLPRWRGMRKLHVSDGQVKAADANAPQPTGLSAATDENVVTGTGATNHVPPASSQLKHQRSQLLQRWPAPHPPAHRPGSVMVPGHSANLMNTVTAADAVSMVNGGPAATLSGLDAGSSTGAASSTGLSGTVTLLLSRITRFTFGPLAGRRRLLPFGLNSPQADGVNSPGSPNGVEKSQSSSSGGDRTAAGDTHSPSAAASGMGSTRRLKRLRAATSSKSKGGMGGSGSKSTLSTATTGAEAAAGLRKKNGRDLYYIAVYCGEQVFKFFPFFETEAEQLAAALTDRTGLRPFSHAAFVHAVMHSRLVVLRQRILEALLREPSPWINHTQPLTQLITSLTNDTEPLKLTHLERLYHSCRVNKTVTTETISQLQFQWDDVGRTAELARTKILLVMDRLLDRSVLHVKDEAFRELYTWIRQIEGELDPYRCAHLLKLLAEMRKKANGIRTHRLPALNPSQLGDSFSMPT